MNIDKKLIEAFELNTVEARVRGLRIEKSGKEFREFKLARFIDINSRFTLENLKENPIIRSYRDFYWRIGIDPTKIRPSSEALLRRVLGGKDIPEINNCVDAYNLASILTLISMGAYDEHKIKGELQIRTSDGEKFLGIGEKEVCTKGEIVMTDAEKILNIYPYRDSDVTKVTYDTTDALLVLAGVNGISNEYLIDSANTAVELITKFCGGRGEVLG